MAPPARANFGFGISDFGFAYTTRDLCKSGFHGRTGALSPPFRHSAIPPFAIRYLLFAIRHSLLFHRHALSQVARLIHIRAAPDGHGIGQPLQRDGVDNGRQQRRGGGDFQQIIGLAAGYLVPFLH